MAAREVERKEMEAEHQRMDAARVARLREAEERAAELKRQQRERAAEDAAADAEAMRPPELQRIFNSLSPQRSEEARRCAEVESAKRMAKAKLIDAEAKRRMQKQTAQRPNPVPELPEEGAAETPPSPGLEARRAELAERAAERAAAHQKRMQDMQQRLKQSSQSWAGATEASTGVGAASSRQQSDPHIDPPKKPEMTNKQAKTAAELNDETPAVPELLRKLRRVQRACAVSR